MKLFALATLLAVGLTATAAAAQTPGPTEIVVSGTGTVAFPPDVANVSATVQTNATNAGDAVSRNNAIYERVVAALTKLGVARNDISLAAYNVNYNPKPQNVPIERDVVYGYTVTRDFSVKVRELGKAGAVVDACTQSGATSIGGVNFGLADEHTAQTQATLKAVGDARAKAEALATASGLHITGIKTINLGGGGPVVPMMRMAPASVAGGTPTQFDNSSVSVSVSVDMTFLAQP